jgi:hypothetical protein
VSVERKYTCDSAECDTNWSDQGLGDDNLPPHLIYVRETGDPHEVHFCSWDCVLKYAATFPPPEIIS